MSLMKEFLDKHILFPRKFGWIPYPYLLFMIPAFAGLMINHVSVPLSILGWFLTLSFLKCYRDGYDGSNPKQPRYIGLQLLIASFLAINPWINTFGLHIFTGFTIGFSGGSKKRLKYYMLAYYTVVVPTYLLAFILLYRESIDLTSLIWIIVSLAFTFISPLFSLTIGQSTILKVKNNELEVQIRQLERERIAYDLHDNVGQAFSTITLQAELVGKLIDKNPARAKEEVVKLAENSRRNLTLVREIVSNLHDDSILSILDDAQKNLKMVDCELVILNEAVLENWTRPNQEVAGAVLREALTNVVHHAKANRVTVDFNHQGFVIADNGIGLGDNQASHGIDGMRHRVESIGGVLHISSGNGTTIGVAFI